MELEHAPLKRRQRLLDLIAPLGTPRDSCSSSSDLFAALDGAYPGEQRNTRRKALQRDLDWLIKQGKIEVLNPGGKPLCYRRRLDGLDDDALVADYDLLRIRDLVAEAVPARRLEVLWTRLQRDGEPPLLDAQRLRMVPDALRLQPADLKPAVVRAVIESLVKGCVLRNLIYQNAQGDRSAPVLHPHALVQRGPLPYLFALKNEEDDPLRLYALHRMIRADADPTTPARRLPDFDLDRAIREGKADFGQGERIDLTLRVRGYLTELLLTCPLSPKQTCQDLPEDSGFQLLVHAPDVLSTGQLLRWLLGAGANLEVMAPLALRQTVAAQAAQMAARYASDPGS